MTFDKSTLAPSAEYQAYLNELSTYFIGDICTDYVDRIAVSTDNSVYQVVPQAVIYPKSTEDLIHTMSIAHQPAYKNIRFAARAGGTGTNGQSLSSGIMVNFTKYMNQIISLDLQQKTVTVQPGVVLDQLNAMLKPHGLFFAPHLSPSNRATVGGMVSTDACGKGSCQYGKTSQHIQRLTVILNDGTEHECQALKQEQWQQISNRRLKRIYEHIAMRTRKLHSEIVARYPKLLRYLTGFDLAHVCDDALTVDLSRLIAGSEGTLAFVTEITLSLTPIPAYKKLFVLMYDDFDQALRSAQKILTSQATAIETIDENVMSLAEKEIERQGLSHCFLQSENQFAKAVNIVEFNSYNQHALQQHVQQLQQIIANNTNSFGSYYLCEDPCEMQKIWNIRAKSVELAGAMPGERKPVSGIEDTVVAPEKLADYVADLKRLLDEKDLDYAMFGHVDAGCLHIRPALNLQSEKDETYYHQLTAKVAALVKQYGGLLWGEHGKGYRSAYLKDFLGETLYQECQQIKALFDANNQLNPGKLFTAADSDEAVVSIEGPKRAHFDKGITPELQQQFQAALLCNGNATCFNYHVDDLMCPSYKVTRDPVHSPAGRANAVREWLRLMDNPDKKVEFAAYSKQVNRAMQGCLGCNACAVDCPMQVSIPQMKSQFLAQYRLQQKPSIRDQLIADSEKFAYKQRQSPRVSNVLSKLMSKTIEKIGFVDVPTPSNVLLSKLIPKSDLLNSKQLPKAKNHGGSVIIIGDQLNATYMPQTIYACYQLIKHLGYQPLVWNNVISGKPMHVMGSLKAFNKVNAKNTHNMNQLFELGYPIIGIEPGLTAIYRSENYTFLRNHRVEYIQEWLTNTIEAQDINKEQLPYYLFSHCNERTTVSNSDKLWQEIFKKLGLTLNTLNLGCCGMAGNYGHEAEHADYSRQLFEMSWANAIKQYQLQPQQILATGFSCREQIQRCTGHNAMHPLEIICQLYLD